MKCHLFIFSRETWPRKATNKHLKVTYIYYSISKHHHHQDLHETSSKTLILSTTSLQPRGHISTPAGHLHPGAYTPCCCCFGKSSNRFHPRLKLLLLPTSSPFTFVLHHHPLISVLSAMTRNGVCVCVYSGGHDVQFGGLLDGPGLHPHHLPGL